MSTSTPGDTGNNSDTAPEDVLATPPVADDITSSLRPTTSSRGGLPIMTYVLAAVVLVGAGFLAGTMLNKESDSNTLAGGGSRAASRAELSRAASQARLPAAAASPSGRSRRSTEIPSTSSRRTERPSPSRRTDRPRCRCRRPERCRTYPRVDGGRAGQFVWRQHGHGADDHGGRLRRCGRREPSRGVDTGS